MKSDPKLPDDAVFPLPPPRPKNVIFEDEEKSKVGLQRRADEGSRAHLGLSECQPLPLEQRLMMITATAVCARHHLLNTYYMLSTPHTVPLHLINTVVCLVSLGLV